MTTKRLELHKITTAFVILLLTCTVLLISIIFYWRIADRIETDEKGRLEALAADIATELQQTIDNHIADVRFAATLPALRRSDLSSERQRLLDNLKHHDSSYAWVGITSNNGVITDASQGLLVGESVAGRDWYEAGHAGLYVGDLHEAKLLGRFLPAMPDGKIPRLIDVAIPIFDVTDKFIGVFCAHLNASMVEEMANSFVARRGRHRQYEILIIGKSNIVVHGPSELEGKVIDPRLYMDSGIRVWGDGKEYLSANAITKDYGGLAWRVVARQAKDIAYEDLTSNVRYIATASLFVLVIFAWMGLCGVRWCLRPLQRIIDTVDTNNADNNQLIQLPNAQEYDEVFRLTLSLNRLFQRIYDHRLEKDALVDSLEQKVIERTSDLTQAQSLLIDAVECIKDAFCLYDENDNVIMCNSHYRSLVPAASTGATFSSIHKSIVGHAIQPINKDESLEDFSAKRLAYRKNPEGFFIVRSNNRLMKIVDRKTSVGGIVSLIHDITDGYEREQALISAKEMADAANKAKSEFLSHMSHELRTPLNAILGYTQVMQIDKREPLTQRQIDSIRYIQQAGEHLLALINEILDLSRIEAGRIDIVIKAVNVLELVDDCLLLIAEAASKKTITVDVTRDVKLPLVLADSLRLKQVLLNVISNSVKYNTQCVVKIRYSREQQYLKISVIDNGVGIQPDKVNKLFQPFSRLGAEYSEIEGTGIGLSISKKLVEMMNGRILFSPTPGGGATFTIEMPLANTPLLLDGLNESNLNQTSSVTLKDSHGLVVYVEDNEANIALMTSVMELMPSVSFTVFRSAEDFLAAIPALNPNLILMDINLPGITGFDALEKFRNISNKNEIPVIAVSAAATSDDRSKGLAAGFVDYLSKPFNVAGILRAINKYLPGFRE